MKLLVLPPASKISLRVRRAATVGAMLGGWAVSLPAQTSGGATQVLPKMEVSANVPLIKVGDFKLREARFAPALVADGDYLYIIGGQDTGRAALDSIERFNVRSGQSENFAKLKTARYWHGAVVFDGKIYVFGGANGQSTSLHDGMAPPDGDLLASRRVGSGGPGSGPEMEAANSLESSVEIVDLATGKISAGVSMPDARVQFASALVDGKIYVMGGKRLGARTVASTNDVEIFDLKRGKWSKGPAMPMPISTTATVVDPGVIVVAGGYDGDRQHNEVSVYNPADKIWRTLPPLHRPVSSHSMVFLGHQLFLFGDFLAPGELVAYDLITKRSEGFAFNYKKARNPAAIVRDSKIYVVGGRDGTDTESVDSIQVYALPKKN